MIESDLCALFKRVPVPSTGMNVYQVQCMYGIIDIKLLRLNGKK